ncbi:MAG: PorP/SprF family type IX secretion system membrane protein [Prevotellaceae bacterium]|jgi:type IX secretion system PorP/SprF family membrane protein|nr:PorP/SprF family type IX secretion system membrane protein [Prevotellaceae bacterium]
MKRAFYFLLFLLPAPTFAGNPDVALNQSHTSGYLLNPAYAGMQEYTFASLQVRTQWVGMPGAPQQQYLFLEHSLAPRKAGVGVALFNEESNVIVNTGGYITYRYTFQLSRRQRLSPAVSIGLTQNRINFDRIVAENPFESAIMTGVEHKMLFNVNMGLLYSFADSWEVGFAAYDLLDNTYSYRSYTTERSSAYSAIRTFALNARYRKVFAENFEAGALLYLYSQQGLPVEPTLRLSFSYLPYGASLYGGYTWDNAFSAGASLWLYDRVSIGYTAEMAQAGVRGYTGLTQQVSLGVRIGQPAQPRPSKVSPRDIEELRRMNQENFEHIERVAQAQEVSRRQVEQQQAKADSLERELESLRQMALAAQAAVSNIPAEQVVTDSALSLTPAQVDTAPNAAAYYVVVGYYLHRSYAERYQAMLASQLQLPTEIFEEADGTCYVYSKKVDTFPEAQREFRRLQQLDNLDRYMVGNVWALKKKSKQ